MINDAVAILMFRAVITTVSKTTMSSLIPAPRILDLDTEDYMNMMIDFFLLSMSSIFMGVIFGLVAALLLKHIAAALRDNHQNDNQSSKDCTILFAIAYLSYLVAEELSLSGIITLFCCGFTLAHYAYHNVTKTCQLGSVLAVETLASVSEGFLYVYLGMSSLSIRMEHVNIPLIAITLIGTIIARFLSVMIPLGLIGLCRK